MGRLRFLLLPAASLLLAWAPTESRSQTAGAIVSEGARHLIAPHLLEGLVKVSATYDLNFGLRPDGRVVSWGDDGLGLVDIVDPAASYLDVSVASLHVLLLRADGSIDAYGGPDTWFPLAPPEPNTGYTAVSAGTMLSMALRDDGSVETWGLSLPPVPEPNSGFTAIAAGYGTAYALRADSTIAVWGSDTYGQHAVPAPNSGFVALSAGEFFAVALRGDGSLAAWGRNQYGQLSLPTPNSGFTAVAAGKQHALALRDDGSVAAWGDNASGKTGLPVPNTGFARIAAGDNHSVAVSDDGRLVAWGRRTTGACGVFPPNDGFLAVNADLAIRADGSLWLHLLGYAPPNVPAPNSGFVQVERRADFTLALRGNGSIAAWGDNFSGQLNVPAPNSGYAAIAAGTSFAVALRDDGSLEAWGDNFSGQLNVPEPNATYVAAAAGAQHAAAVRADGSVSVWGYNLPVPPATETGFVAVAAGRNHTMALHEDGHIAVWGNWAPAAAVPEPNSGFVAISAEESTCLAMREDGTLVAWGHYVWDGGPLFGGSRRIQAFDLSGNVACAVETQSVTAVAPPPRARSALVLGALPNPFNPTLTVWFAAPTDDRVVIDVFDLRGRRVRALWRGDLVASQRRSAVWDGRDDAGARLASGTYVVKLTGKRGGTATRSVSLVK